MDDCLRSGFRERGEVCLVAGDMMDKGRRGGGTIDVYPCD
jgi:hypothetical protein